MLTFPPGYFLTKRSMKPGFAVKLSICDLPESKRWKISNIQRSLTGVYGRMAGVRLPFGHDNVNTDANQLCQ